MIRRLKRLWFGGLARTRIYRRLIVRERILEHPAADVALRAQVHVSLLTADAIEAYLALRRDQSAVEVRRRLDEGQRCFIVWHDGRVIHAAWAVTGRARVEYLGTEIVLAPDEVWVHEVFTSPAFRGLGASPARMTEMMRYFRDRGYRSLIGGILPENGPSLRLGDKVGWTRSVGVIGFVGLGPWRHVFCRRERGAWSP